MKKIWIKNTIKTLGAVFGVFGAISIFFPLTEVTRENIVPRSACLLIVIVIVAIVSFIWTRSMIKRKSISVFADVNTKIVFEYADIKQILDNACGDKNKITVVVPVNTRLDKVFDRDYIRDGTIHRICLDYINTKIVQEKKHEFSLNKSILENVKIKKDGFAINGKLGDWFLLTSEELGINGNIQFMFAEIFNLEEKNGKIVNSELKKEQYLSLIQMLISTIPDAVDHENQVYIPLIGAGYGKIGTPENIMHIMNALLRFNKEALHQEIHVFINEKYKDSTPIYRLIEY